MRIQIEMQLVGKHFARHRLTGAARPGEERADAEAARAYRGESPVVVNPAALAHVYGDFLEDLLLRLGQDQISPARLGLDALGQPVEPRPRLHPAGLPERGAQVAGLRAVQRSGASRTDRAAVKIELRAEDFHAAVQARRRRAQVAPPHEPLLLGRRLHDVESDHRSLQAVAPRAPAHDQDSADFLQHTVERRLAAGVGVVTVAGFDQQTRAAQDRFALPQAEKRVQLGGMDRQSARRDRVEIETELSAGGRRDLPLASRLVAAKLHDRRDGLSSRRPDPGHRLGLCAVRLRQLGGRGQPFEHAVQTLVEMGHAGKIMQHALIDANAALREAFPANFDQAPAAQRPSGRERAPVRFAEHGQRQAEGRISAVRAVLRRGDQPGKTRVEFDPGAEQQDFFFEARQPERAAESARWPAAG